MELFYRYIIKYSVKIISSQMFRFTTKAGLVQVEVVLNEWYKLKKEGINIQKKSLLLRY